MSVTSGDTAAALKAVRDAGRNGEKLIVARDAGEFVSLETERMPGGDRKLVAALLTRLPGSFGSNACSVRQQRQAIPHLVFF
jgi:hypothetical protein